MAASITKIYRSSNRARWQPLQTADPTSILVRHMPNSSPGRQTTDTAVTDFLSKNGSGPDTPLCGGGWRALRPEQPVPSASLEIGVSSHPKGIHSVALRMRAYCAQ